jgi:hypothetical protein
VAGALAFIFNPAAPGTPSPAPFSVLLDGTQSGAISEQKNLRIRSADELSAVWDMLYASSTPPVMPLVDFTNDEVLAVFDGTHATGGYSVRVASITDTNGTRSVVIEHTMPGSGCMATQMLTSPFEFVIVPLTTATLTHEDVTKVNDCQ